MTNHSIYSEFHRELVDSEVPIQNSGTNQSRGFNGYEYEVEAGEHGTVRLYEDSETGRVKAYGSKGGFEKVTEDLESGQREIQAHLG